MTDDKLVGLYELDLAILKREGYITDTTSNDEKYRLVRLQQQYIMSEDSIENMTKKKYMLQNPDNYQSDFALVGKWVYFVHCGKVGEGDVKAISRWFDRMYRIKSNLWEVDASVHHSSIFLTLDELLEALNTKYEIKGKK
jgi:hypothetical protein